MKRILLIFIFCLPGAHCFSSDAGKLTFEYSINNSYQCRALKINKNYLLTSAHCVAEFCKEKCEITVFAAAPVRVSHTSSSPKVFWQSGFSFNNMGTASRDVALIKADSPLPGGVAQFKFLAAAGGVYASKTQQFSAHSGIEFQIPGPLVYIEKGGIIAVENMPPQGLHSGSPVFSALGVVAGIVSNASTGGHKATLTPFTKENINFMSKAGHIQTVDMADLWAPLPNE